MPRRHGCFTAFLACILIADTFAVIALPMMFSMIKKTMPNLSTGMLAALIFCALANIVFAIAIIKWKRWGFYGYIAVSVVGCIVNLSLGRGIIQAAIGLLSIALLYWVMNMGGPNKAWPHLK